MIKLATTKSVGRYITCKYCDQEKFVIGNSTNKIDKDSFTCSEDCQERYHLNLCDALSAHDEYCDLCNPNIARLEKEKDSHNGK